MISARRLFRLASIIGAAVALHSCGGGGGGGGGGGPSGPSFTVSPASLTFSAPGNGVSPVAKAVTLTTSGVSGALFVRTTLPGIVALVSGVSITGPNTGQAFVTPVNPSTLGPGTYTGTISVVACTTDINCSGPLLGGSPQTVAVTYTVTPTLQGDAVAPHAVASGVAGEVVIRGQSIGALTGVSFGVNGTTGFTQVGPTEVRASYPALAAGSYAVQLQSASGPVPFTGSLVVVNPVSYTPTTLAYPASPGNFRSLIHDAPRQAIVVATDTQLLRYAFSGGAFQAPVQLPVSSLRDIALSLDGASLLAVTTDTLKEFDPATLAQTRSTSGDLGPGFISPTFQRLAIANDGNALVGNVDIGAWVYPTRNPGFYLGGEVTSTIGAIPFGALPAASANGSLVAFIQGQLSPAPLALKYSASAGTLAPTSVHLNRISPNTLDANPSPAVDRSGTRIAFNSSVGDFSGIVVFDENMTLIGALPGTTVATAFAPNPSGSAVRAYTLDAGKLRAFDLTSVTAGNFNEITTPPYPITLGAGIGNHPALLITLDGANAIAAGDQQIVVVNTP